MIRSDIAYFASLRRAGRPRIWLRRTTPSGPMGLWLQVGVSRPCWLWPERNRRRRTGAKLNVRSWSI